MVFFRNISKAKMDLDVKEIHKRQELFSSTVKSYFIVKIAKYRHVLEKTGVSLSSCDVPQEGRARMSRSQSFEEHIQLVLGHGSISPVAYRSLWKIGNRISATRIFQWIYEMVRRTKATRILRHLDGIPDAGLQSVVLDVAQEIAVAYEFQLCMLAGEYEIVQLGQHAVLCMLAYLNAPDAHFGREELLQAILEVKPQSGLNRSIVKTRPVTFDGQTVCLRWRLSQILKQPGLRICHNGAMTDNDIKLKSVSSVAGEGLNCAETSSEKNSAEILEENRAGHMGKVDEVDFRDPEDPTEKRGKLNRLESDKGRVARTIRAVEMDYENGCMKITDHYCEVSDFSPVENTAPLSEYDDTTVGEELDFDGEDFREADEINKETLKSSHNDTSAITHISTEIIPKCHDKSDVARQQATENISEMVQATVHVHINANSCETENVSVENAQCVNKTSKGNDTEVEVLSLESETVQQEEQTEMKHSDKSKVESDISDDKFRNDFECNIANVKSIGDSKQTTDMYDTIEDDNERKAAAGNLTVGYRFYGCFTPYGAKCRPEIYGYRGPLHVWNEKTKKNSLIYSDSVTVATLHKREVVFCPTDFHQSYIPKTKCDH